MMQYPLLTAQQVGVEVSGKRLLSNVDVEVRPGEVVAIAGPNCAGKSTLLRALAGDLTPTSGHVTLDGSPLASYRPADLATRRAVLPQQTLLQFAFTAREVVEIGRRPLAASREADAAVIARCMEQTETTHLGGRTYPSLSGGEQARVQLARVMAQEAPLLLLDEPTAALDLRHQHLVMEIAREVALAGGSVVAVLHDLNLAASHADRIVVLRDGKVIADGKPWEVCREALLSEVYGCPIAVCRHPHRSCPLVMALPSGYACGRGDEVIPSGVEESSSPS
jgi:iron complex transport system ATP-binding protein